MNKAKAVETEKPQQTNLDKAKALVAGNRQSDYGPPEDSMSAIAELWNAYLSVLNGKKITAKDAAVMMSLVKIARMGAGEKKDNYVACAGYIHIAAMCAGKKRKKRRAYSKGVT